MSHTISQEKELYCCPFDNNHIIDAKKYEKHVLKCKSPNRKDFRQCPRNPYHWVHFSRLQDHQLCKSSCRQLAKGRVSRAVVWESSSLSRSGNNKGGDAKIHRLQT